MRNISVIFIVICYLLIIDVTLSSSQTKPSTTHKSSKPQQLITPQLTTFLLSKWNNKTIPSAVAAQGILA